MVATGRYRSIFHTPLPADEAFATAERELRAWIGSKHLDQQAFDRGIARIGQGVILLANARNAPDGTQTKRWQLRETRTGGAWLTTLTVHSPGRSAPDERSWFWLDVEFVPAPGDPNDDQEAAPGRKAGVPRLARSILDAVDARDSIAQLTQRPVLTRPDDVDQLIDILCDPDRRMPTIVATPHPRIGFEDWRATIERVTWHTAGLASLYILDPPAVDRFHHEIGHTYAVWDGAVRSYLPGVDPASAENAIRHRVMVAANIERDPGRAAGLMSGLPRRLSAEARLPRPLSGVTRKLLAEYSSEPSPHPSTTGEMEVSALRNEVARLRSDLDAALELVTEAERTEERLAERNDQLDALSTEFAATNQRAEHLHDQVRSLRRRLTDIGRATEAYAPADDRTDLPTSFAALLERIGDLPRIAFTGESDFPLALDDMPSAASWAQTAWQAMTAMNAYADASAQGRFAGGFVAWCKEPPSGEHAISPGKVAPDESETVKNDSKMRHARILPVPIDVAPSGKVFMGAHVRLGGGAGMKAPRMHYFDDVKHTGKVYIGYLGPHLKVKSTN